MIILKIAEALNKKDERGFTLIELLVVIGILAILAAIAIPLVGNRIEKARASADVANVRMLQGAVELWVVDNSSDPEADLKVASDDKDWQDNLVDGDFLKERVKSPYKDKGYTLSDKPYKVNSDASENWDVLGDDNPKP